MKNQCLLLLAMTPLIKSGEPAGDKPFFKKNQIEALEKGGMGSDAGMKAPGGSHSLFVANNLAENWVHSASSMYENMSPSVSSAIDTTVKTGVGLGASYVAYKVGRPLYNHFRPSLEDRIRSEENKKKLYELEQERFRREKDQQKYALVNELSKCAYNNSSSSHIDSWGIPQGCSSTTFKLVMGYQDGFDHMRGIGSRIKQLRGENNSK